VQRQVVCKAAVESQGAAHEGRHLVVQRDVAAPDHGRRRTAGAAHTRTVENTITQVRRGHTTYDSPRPQKAPRSSRAAAGSDQQAQCRHKSSKTAAPPPSRSNVRKKGVQQVFVGVPVGHKPEQQGGGMRMRQQLDRSTQRRTIWWQGGRWGSDGGCWTNTEQSYVRRNDVHREPYLFSRPRFDGTDTDTKRRPGNRALGGGGAGQPLHHLNAQSLLGEEECTCDWVPTHTAGDGFAATASRTGLDLPLALRYTPGLMLLQPEQQRRQARVACCNHAPMPRACKATVSCGVTPHESSTTRGATVHHRPSVSSAAWRAYLDTPSRTILDMMPGRGHARTRHGTLGGWRSGVDGGGGGGGHGMNRPPSGGADARPLVPATPTRGTQR
jgi:hypothetical protein